LQYREWQWLNSNDFTQQRYKEGIDSVNHLCNNIVPGTINS